MRDAPVIGAIVLAAGASSRMGRAKALLPLRPGGPTFVEAIVATLAASGVTAWRVVVAPELLEAVDQAVVNPDPSRGMLSSALCGLGALLRLEPPPDAVLLWPVDHPLVTKETIGAMIAAFRDSDAPVVVPTHAGRRGHPVLVAARVFPELFAADPSRGARSVVHAHDDRIELAVADRGVVSDIDTPDDYERLAGAPPRPPSEVA